MRYWPSKVTAVIFVVLSCTTVGCALRKRAQEKREITYQSALRSYSEVLKPGMTRREVEDYLRAKNIEFRQMCCVEDARSAYADLTKIGKEHVPWYCERHNVYVAFQFAAVEAHKPYEARDSDTLGKMSIFHWLEGCM
jgi:hypothetical protein